MAGRETAQHRKERGRVEGHDKEARMCTSEAMKGKKGQEHWGIEIDQRAENRGGGGERSEKTDYRT